jgi:hypothetical protein
VQHGPGQPQQRLGVGEHPNHIGATFDLLMWNGFVKATILVVPASAGPFVSSPGEEGVNVERPQRSEDERR